MAVEQLQINVIGMSCEHCRCRVQRALEALPGVCTVVINLETGAVNVEAEPGTTTRENLVAAVEEVGYSAGTMSTP
jgi:copper chaperone CopZ